MNYIKYFSKLILLALFIMLVISLIYKYHQNHYGYEYLSMEDEFGISKKCYMNDKGLFCKVDSGLIEVKQFRKR